jgi:hypothetical protein
MTSEPMMRRILLRTYLFAVTLCIWTAPLGAQVYPNIPANTVIGRLGAGVAGPPQAIPFATLNSQLTLLTIGGGLGFRFNKNGTAQTGISNNLYTRVTWSTTVFNTTGAALTSNTWTAPYAGLLLLSAHGWCSLNCLNTPDSGSPTFVLKFIKNSASGDCSGLDVTAGIGNPALGGGANGAATVVPVIDQAAAGDVYELCVFATSSDSGNDIQLDGNHAHTWWSGAYIR